MIQPIRTSGGPLLLFQASLKLGVDILYAFDPKLDTEPQLVSKSYDGVRKCHRLVGDLILVERILDVYLADLSKGTARPLLDTKRGLEILAVEGPTFYLLQCGHELTFQPFTWVENDGPEFDLRIEKYSPESWKLFTLTRGGSPEPVALDEDPFEALLATTRDRFWVVRGSPPALWTIGKDGKGKRKVFEFPKGSVPPLFTAEPSPDGRLLAVGTPTFATATCT